MSINNLMKTIALKERCDSLHTGGLALQVVSDTKQGIIGFDFNVVVVGTPAASQERVADVTNDVIQRVKAFENQLRADYPEFVFSFEGQAAGLKAEFDSPEQRADFETENAELLKQAKAEFFAPKADDETLEA
jgi:hypothetical protein